MARGMKVNGKMESFMERGLKHSQMEPSLMESGLKEDHLAQECANTQMELNTLEIGLMVNLTGKA